MSQQEVKWKHIYSYFSKRNYEIYNEGGDTASRTRNVIKIGHKCSNKPGAQVYDCYINNIRSAFGVTRKDLLSEY